MILSSYLTIRGTFHTAFFLTTHKPTRSGHFLVLHRYLLIQKLKKTSTYAGQRTIDNAIHTMSLQQGEVMVKGAGSGRDATL